ncbi:MAG: phosphotransferase [Candidatus Binatia bacterium]
MTADDVLHHLAARLPGFRPHGSPRRLPGGNLNYVWRVLGEVQAVIVKTAPPHVATRPEIPLDPRRILFEARALEMLGPGGALAGISSAGCRAPRLLDVDPLRHALVMEDAGDVPDLHAWLSSGTAADECGTRLGRFIGLLHGRSFGDRSIARHFDNADVQRTRHEIQYLAVEELCRRAGIRDAPGLGATARSLGERLLRPGVCLTMGDLWPPSVLVAESGLRVIDWELAHFGSPAQDLGHLAAHLWMQAHRAKDEERAGKVNSCLRAFFEAYVSALGGLRNQLLGSEVIAACAIHFGAEVLARAVGRFRSGYIYDGLSDASDAVREAASFASVQIRSPCQSQIFAPLSLDEVTVRLISRPLVWSAETIHGMELGSGRPLEVVHEIAPRWIEEGEMRKAAALGTMLLLITSSVASLAEDDRSRSRTTRGRRRGPRRRRNSGAGDRGDKFEHYKRVPSLRQYVLVSHRDREVEVWTRDAANGWTRSVSRDGERASLASMGAHLDVRDLYDATTEPRA